MEPLIRAGDAVGVVPATGEALAVGEIAVFTRDGREFVHRVIGKRRQGGCLLLREKGDANLLASWIPGSAVIGRAVWVSRGARIRRLHPAGASGALRLLTSASRLEADISGLLLPPAVPGTPGGTGRLTAGARTLLRLLRPIGLPLLAAAYPAVDPGEDAPEMTFLIDCFRRGLSARPDALAAVPEGLDWPLVLQLAALHGVAAELARAADPLLPDDVRREVRRSRVHAGVAHAEALATLRDADRCLGEEGIPFLVLKGPALAGRFYASGTERPAADLDLLVPRALRERACDALERHGYRPERTGTAARLLERIHFHRVLLPGGSGRLPIEVHGDLMDRANLHRVDAPGVLARRIVAQMGGFRAPVPAPEDELLYLALHAARHGLFNRAGLKAGKPAAWFCLPRRGNRLVWFSDLLRFLAAHAGRIDRDLVARRAGEWNVIEEVRDTLQLLALLLPSTEGEALLLRLGGRPLPFAAEGGSGERVRGSTGSRLTAHPLMRMSGLAHFRPARVPGLLGVLFPSPGRLAGYWRAKSPAALPLLYLRHPFHVMARIFGGSPP